MASAITRDPALEDIREAAWHVGQRIALAMGPGWYRPLVDSPAVVYRPSLVTPDGAAWAILTPGSSAPAPADVTIGGPAAPLSWLGTGRVHDWIHALAWGLYLCGIRYAWPGVFRDGWDASRLPFYPPFGLDLYQYIADNLAGTDPYADWRNCPFADFDGTPTDLYSEITVTPAFNGLYYGTAARQAALLAGIANAHTYGGFLGSLAYLPGSMAQRILDQPAPDGTLLCQSPLGIPLRWRVWQSVGGTMVQTHQGDGITLATDIPLAEYYERAVHVFASFL